MAAPGITVDKTLHTELLCHIGTVKHEIFMFNLTLYIEHYKAMKHLVDNKILINIQTCETLNLSFNVTIQLGYNKLLQNTSHH